MNERIVLCTIVAQNYLAQARALARSARHFHPGIDFRVLVVDHGGTLQDAEASSLMQLDDPHSFLPVQRVQNMAFRYNIMEFSTALKPFYLSHLLNLGYSRVVYLDPDILIFSPMDEVLKALSESSILLIPHLLEPIPLDGKKPTEITILLAGAYNLGFIGISQSVDTTAFLAWWSERLLKDCRDAPTEGLFVDQKWVDLIPGLFNGVRLLKHPGCDVAYWNLHARPLRDVNGTFALQSGPLVFFHFTGFDADRPGELSKYQDRIVVDQDPVLIRLLAHYAKVLKAEDFDVYQKRPYGYATFSNGEPITDKVRGIFARQEQGVPEFAAPFNAETKSGFFDTLNRPPLREAEASGGRACVVLAEPVHSSCTAWLRDVLQSLRRMRWDVTVLDASGGFTIPEPGQTLGTYEAFCSENSVAWIPLPLETRPHAMDLMENPGPYRVYAWLRKNDFGLVVADLRFAPAYFALAARQTGVAFQQTGFAILATSTSYFDLEQHELFIEDPVVLHRDFLEQRCAEWADQLNGGTEALRLWMVRRQWHASQLVPLPELPLGQVPRKPAAASSLPRISVCLAHHDRPHYLRQAISSLIKQTYTNFDVVLVDDGSRDPAALACLDELEADFQKRGWKIVRQANAYLGAARNRAVRESAGEYVLFMDDDNLARTDEIATFATAAQMTGADVLTCFYDAFAGDEPPRGEEQIQYRYVPTGGPAVSGIFANCFGDANALVRREAFDRVGGFMEMSGVATQDYELFAKLSLHGYRIDVIPESLYYYRVSEQGMRLTSGHYRNQLCALTPYKKAVPETLRPLLNLGAGLATRIPRDAHNLRVASAERDQLRAEVNSMKNSLSWKITRILREFDRLRRKHFSGGVS